MIQTKSADHRRALSETTHLVNGQQNAHGSGEEEDVAVPAQNRSVSATQPPQMHAPEIANTTSLDQHIPSSLNGHPRRVHAEIGRALSSDETDPETGKEALQVPPLGREEALRQVVLEEADGRPGGSEREGEEGRRCDRADESAVDAVFRSVEVSGFSRCDLCEGPRATHAFKNFFHRVSVPRTARAPKNLLAPRNSPRTKLWTQSEADAQSSSFSHPDESTHPEKTSQHDCSSGCRTAQVSLL